MCCEASWTSVKEISLENSFYCCTEVSDGEENVLTFLAERFLDYCYRVILHFHCVSQSEALHQSRRAARTLAEISLFCIEINLENTKLQHRLHLPFPFTVGFLFLMELQIKHDCCVLEDSAAREHFVRHKKSPEFLG